ncbi:MAG: hypothetical protein J7K08_02900 [Thermoplasmata archaeon]|nr:hypothetical protein [Thermoplasmata archaeon]HDD59489.1 hypothetical protein [Euryarchaeota archaeon]RLF55061.1 MAG: hypothetical protein DRN28_04140 [Thermoplasmata archaeon]RLF70053.1 MAG: hypothetical protein DRN35_04950 [Thermoplasmata archaeon]RLF73163.1 MAG: hypothetical protein DRN55_04350 [Thermoplasmata archaeon]
MTLRETLAVISIVIAVAAVPLTYVAKYSLRNRKLTTLFAAMGAVSVMLFIYLVWDYIPE